MKEEITFNYYHHPVPFPHKRLTATKLHLTFTVHLDKRIPRVNPSVMLYRDHISSVVSLQYLCRLHGQRYTVILYFTHYVSFQLQFLRHEGSQSFYDYRLPLLYFVYPNTPS